MIVLIDPPVLTADAATYLVSTFPGAVGTEELLYFATQQLGLRGEWIHNAAQPDERFVLRGRSVKNAIEKGAKRLSITDAAEVLRYKRYLHATSPQDRIDRRLVARYVLALVDLGCTNLELAAEAAADTYMIEHVIAAAEMGEAMERFSGGYATWRDETGTPSQCGRCGKICTALAPESHQMGYGAVIGALEPDVDLFYRCDECKAAVREEDRLRELDQRLLNMVTAARSVN